MSTPAINPTHAIDRNKLEFYKSKNTPLVAAKIMEGNQRHAAEVRQKATTDSQTTTRLNGECSEATAYFNSIDRALADATSISPHDRELHESAKASLTAAEQRRADHQKKMVLKKKERWGAHMADDELDKQAVRLLHRPMTLIDFPPVKDSEATTESLFKIFDKIFGVRRDIAETQAAFLPPHDAFDDFKRDVDYALKTKFHTNPLAEYFHVRYLDGDPLKPQRPQVSLDIPSLAMRAVREMILSFGENVFRDLGERLAFEGEPLGRAERKKIIADHFAAIDALELEEGRIRRALATKGIFVPLRADTRNLLSVLGVGFDAEEDARRKGENPPEPEPTPEERYKHPADLPKFDNRDADGARVGEYVNRGRNKPTASPGHTRA